MVYIQVTADPAAADKVLRPKILLCTDQVTEHVQPLIGFNHCYIVAPRRQDNNVVGT